MYSYYFIHIVMELSQGLSLCLSQTLSKIFHNAPSHGAELLLRTAYGLPQHPLLCFITDLAKGFAKGTATNIVKGCVTNG